MNRLTKAQAAEQHDRHRIRVKYREQRAAHRARQLDFRFRGSDCAAAKRGIVHKIHRAFVVSASLLFLLAVAAAPARAQVLTTICSFNSTDGESPIGLVQGTDGNLYGTSVDGGANQSCTFGGCGTAFKITTAGALTTLYNFCSKRNCADGDQPDGLVQGGDGNFYGTTGAGGLLVGTVFKLTPTGVLTTLHEFDTTDGSGPFGIVEASDGNFYGTTGEGGAHGLGKIFKITPGGTFTSLHNLSATDGAYPSALLIQATDGSLYRTTITYGAYDGGTIYKTTLAGTLTVVYNFCQQSNCADGEQGNGVIQGIDGNFYGTTYAGGSYDVGTVFKLTPAGVLTTLYTFCPQSGCADGSYPVGQLLQATDGNLYGATSRGGDNDLGTIFRISTAGAFKTLYSFCSQSACADGELPGALIQDTNGMIYGATSGGGTGVSCGCGTVFSLNVGLPPFVKTQPTSGRVGAKINILGTNLAGAASVTFNGTAATFTVASPSLITTTVPAGATTGTVKVLTPGGTLKSNVAFRVIP
jgi:uncharacterized repeat protein (TIGR03803 family)